MKRLFSTVNADTLKYAVVPAALSLLASLTANLGVTSGVSKTSILLGAAAIAPAIGAFIYNYAGAWSLTKIARAGIAAGLTGMLFAGAAAGVSVGKPNPLPAIPTSMEIRQ